MKKVASGTRLVFGYLGIFLWFISIITFLPLVMLIFYPEESHVIWNFLIPGFSTLALGSILYFTLIFRRERARLGKHQDQVLLVMVWVVAVLICAVPFALSGKMSFTESVFESVSGYATVGLTRFKFDMEGLHVYLFYRSLLLFFGGVGLVLIITSALSDRYGLRLYVAEGHNDKLMPNLTRSARLILAIYVLYIALGTIAFIISGMSAFDAINHSIAAIATGGFSTYPEGFMACGGNPTVNQIICSVLMLLGGTNFLIHLFLITGKFKRVVKDLEIRFFGILSAVMIPLFVVSFCVGKNAVSFGQGISYGVFTYISSVTTSGFTNVPIGYVFGGGTMFLVILMCVIGGGMGSTSGGSKQYRVALAFKASHWNLRSRSTSKNLVYPRKVYRCGQYRNVEQSEIMEAFAYILVYIVTLALGSFLLMAFGGGNFTLGDCFFEFANGLSSAGLSCGLTANANNGMMWVLILGMFAGRLEIIPIYFMFYRAIHDLFRKEID